MSDRTTPTALIAEDEPLLASALKKSLAVAWPELAIVATVGDGMSAVAQTLALAPDILFLDIRMPGLSGLDAAADIADGWGAGPTAGKPFPALVFVTAYDQYAVRAFEARAVDYLLKPLQETRLRQTVARLQQTLATRGSPEHGRIGAAMGANPTLEQALERLRELMSMPAAAPAAHLGVLQASVGNVIHVVPVDEVLFLEAADKYVRVLTAQHEYLIRTPLRELLPQLDGARFWQVHRAHVVRVQAIDTVTRDEAGKLWLQLRGRPERIAVSRLYAHLFKAM